MKKIFLPLLLIMPLNALAGYEVAKTADEFVNSIRHDDTECATKVMSDALKEMASGIDANAPESEIEEWAYTIFNDAHVLFQVSMCPEIQKAAPGAVISFKPPRFTFPNGREVAIQYETTPATIEQRLKLAEKRSIDRFKPNGDGFGDGAIWTNTDPAWYAIMITQHGAMDQFIGPGRDNLVPLSYIYSNIDSVYPNTDGGNCTDRGAISRDKTKINLATTHAVNNPAEDNDYYVAGNVDYGWIMYAEIAADVALAIVTMGGSAAIQGGATAARLTRVVKTSKSTVNAIKAANNVKDIGQLSRRAATLRELADNITKAKKITKADNITDVKQYEKILKNMKNVDSDDMKILEGIVNNGDDANKKLETISKQVKKLNDDYAKALKATETIADAEKQIDALKSAKKTYDTLTDSIKTLEKTTDVQDYLKYTKRIQDTEKKLGQADDAIKAAQQQIDNLKNIPNKTKELNRAKDARRRAEKAHKSAKDSLEYSKRALRNVENSDNVLKYKNAVSRMDKLKDETSRFQFFNRLFRTQPGRTGNVAARAYRTFNGYRNAGSAANTLQKAARASTFSGRARDWLFHSTMRNIGALGRLQGKVGFWYTVVKFAGDMYDQTSDSTAAYTNNIDFKPFLLLSADDLQSTGEDQSNVVNYGMWLMWVGDSISAADDDAAYLQATNFAEHLHQEIVKDPGDCNIDIFVVRPVIRNPGSEDKMYYLIMNDQPWTTAQ